MSRWIRSYIDDLSDPKIQNLAPTDHKIWTNVQLVAGLADGDAPGSNGTVRLGDLAFHLRIKEQQLVRRLEVLVAAGPARSGRRRPCACATGRCGSAESDASAGRVRDWRERQGKGAECNVTEPLPKTPRGGHDGVTPGVSETGRQPLQKRSGRDPPLVSGNGSVSHQIRFQIRN